MEDHANGPAPSVAAVLSHLSSGLVGHDALIRRLLVALLAQGHLLIEGPPGIAKTRAVKWLAGAAEGSFARIQCTPDLMPSDVTGTQVFHPGDGSFEFAPGPVFHNLVLVDEINRAPPKVQSSLLEAMAERQVTAGGTTRVLPDPFLVVATQNPIEQDGTFPLPEAQLDRFLLHVELSLPDAQSERRILDLLETEERGIDAPVDTGPLVSQADLNTARKAVRDVYLAPELKDYIVRLVMATREGPFAQEISHAVSPRGSLALAAVARVSAYLDGRDYAVPADVAEMAADALAHRMVLTWKAVAEGRTARSLVADILKDVEPL